MLRVWMVIKQVTDRMNLVNWNKHNSQWNHVKGIQFLELSSKNYIDILLGVYYPQFHISLKEVKIKIHLG